MFKNYKLTKKRVLQTVYASLLSFNSNKTADGVFLKIIVNGKLFVIEALCVPYICSDIFARNIKISSRN